MRRNSNCFETQNLKGEKRINISKLLQLVLTCVA